MSARAYFIGGSADGMRLNLEGDPPPTWKVPDPVAMSAAQAYPELDRPVPVSVYRLVSITPNRNAVYEFVGIS